MVTAGVGETVGFELRQGGAIEATDENESYKYFGMQQTRGIEHKYIKETLKKKFFQSVEAILKTKLSGKHTIKAINTYTISLLTYSFGTIKWTQTELHDIQTKINKSLTKFHIHHPKSATERLTLPSKQGGRGLIDITDLHNKQMNNLCQYFYKKMETSQLHNAIVLTDVKYMPLNLQTNKVSQDTNKIMSDADKIQQWCQKVLHGRYLYELNQEYIDKNRSHAWLTQSDIFPETEGFMCAIMD
jgi:hypothetical protein